MAGDNRNATDVFDLIADIVIARRSAWRDKAACKAHDPEIFFPKQNNPTGYQRAKAICMNCPVRKDCQDDWQKMPPAMQRHGVWFGKTDRDRKAMR